MGELLTAIAIFGLAATSIVGWITNLVWTFGQSGGDLALGLAGIFIPFVGMVHGIYLWF